MNKKNTKKYVLIAGLFFPIVISFFLFSYEKLHTYQTSLSLELGFSSLSPNSSPGGEILPASCESGSLHEMSGCDMTFWADSTLLPYGGSTSLHWYVPTGNVNVYSGVMNSHPGYPDGLEIGHIQSCVASGDWSGDQNAKPFPETYSYWSTIGGGYHFYARQSDSGTGSLTSTKTYNLTCTINYPGAGGQDVVTKSVTVNVGPPPAPTVSIAPADQTITLGQNANYTVTSSSDASNIVSDRLIWQPPNYVDYPQLFYGWSYGGSSSTYAGGTPNDTADGNGFTRFAATNSQSTAYTFTPTQAGIYYFRGGAGADGSWYFSPLSGANLTVLEPIPSTLKICRDSCTSNAPLNDSVFTMERGVTAAALYACFGTGTCSIEDNPVSGTWSKTNTPTNAVSLSPSSGASTIATGTAAGQERIDLTYSGSIVSTTADVICNPTVFCSSQAINHCSDTTFTIPDNGCGTPISGCDGTRSCDYNWKEVAP